MISHEVLSGETLAGILQRYNLPRLYNVIKIFNPQIKDPDKIQKGWKLRLPQYAEEIRAVYKLAKEQGLIGEEELSEAQGLVRQFPEGKGPPVKLPGLAPFLEKALFPKLPPRAFEALKSAAVYASKARPGAMEEFQTEFRRVLSGISPLWPKVESLKGVRSLYFSLPPESRRIFTRSLIKVRPDLYDIWRNYWKAVGKRK